MQEALTNVRKHADSKRVTVSIVFEDGVVTARIVDEGRGFNPDNKPPGHYGLSTIRERAQCLGGELSISSGGAGTVVSVRLPAFWTC